MAFTGLHVVCAYAGSKSNRDKSQAILGDILWTEAPASGSASTNIAPSPSDVMGDPMFRIAAASDSWVSIGTSPNPATNPRFLVRSGTDYDVFVDAGDKIAWIAA